MKSGTLLRLAREDNKTFFQLGLICIGICLFIFALHWNLIYNTIFGPFSIDKSILSGKSTKKYVLIDTTLSLVGSKNTSISIKGLKLPEVETARIMQFAYNDTFLIVLASKDFKDKKLKGGIVPLPEELRNTLPDNQPYYNVMVDAQVSYPFDTDIFMLLALLLFPFTLILGVIGFIKYSDSYKHRSIIKLNKFGRPIVVIEQIEREFASKKEHTDSPVYISENWVVIAVSTCFDIIHTSDLVAYGISKNKYGDESVSLWLRGVFISKSVTAKPEIIKEILTKLKAAFPKRFIYNTTEFEKEWSVNRKELETKIDMTKIVNNELNLPDPDGLVEKYTTMKLSRMYAVATETGFQIRITLYWIYKYVDHTILAFLGIPDPHNTKSGFILYCKIPHTTKNGKLLYDKSLTIWLPKFKEETDRLNFANSLNDFLDFPIRNQPFRGCKFPVCTEKSTNFTPVNIQENEMHVNILDVNDEHFFDLEVNWQKKWVIFTIPKNKKDSFITCFFTNKPVFRNQDIEIPQNGKELEVIDVKGFDKMGEPQIFIYDNELIKLHFNFMPPFDFEYGGTSMGKFEHFDRDLQYHLDTRVIWEDREVFLIPYPKSDTVAKLKDFLENFRKPPIIDKYLN